VREFKIGGGSDLEVLYKQVSRMVVRPTDEEIARALVGLILANREKIRAPVAKRARWQMGPSPIRILLAALIAAGLLFLFQR